MTNTMDYIEQIVQEFVAPRSKKRLQYLLSKPKRRGEILSHFHDDYHFDSRYLHAIAPGDQTSDKIYLLMKEKGASEKCFAFSGIESLNGELMLKDALNECVGMTIETILYCWETKVGYWEGGHAHYRWILHKGRS